MKYNTFRSQVKLPIFTPQNLRNLDVVLYPNELTRWIKLGYITKLRGGLYAFTEQLKTISPHIIASKLVTPSYLSLTTVLSLHAIIPEATFTITSVTTKGTRSYDLGSDHFTYQHIPPKLYFGYTSVVASPLSYYLAEPEKALLDYFYLTPSIKNSKDLYELRLNLENIDWPKLRFYLAAFKHKRLDYLVKLLEGMHAYT